MKNVSKLAMVSALGAVLMAGPTAAVYATETAVSVEKQIATAKTKADHEAIAAFFEKEAKEAQEKAEVMRKMADSYGKATEAGGYARVKGGLAVHCNAIGSRYDEAAKEALELAKQHHKLAAGAK